MIDLATSYTRLKWVSNRGGILKLLNSLERIGEKICSIPIFAPI
jgi:hypothetical protein